MNEKVTIVDARNLLCPMPVIRTQNAVAGAAAGQKIEVLCTDPGAKNDVPAWCRINGHRLLSIDESETEISILIQVGEK